MTNNAEYYQECQNIAMETIRKIAQEAGIGNRSMIFSMNQSIIINGLFTPIIKWITYTNNHMDILRISMNCDYYKENISDSIKNFNSFEEILMAYAFYAMLKDCMEYIDEEIFDQIVKEIEAEEEGKE